MTAASALKNRSCRTYRQVAAALALVLYVGCLVQFSDALAGPATRPTTAVAAPDLRDIHGRFQGPVEELRGIRWPRDNSGRYNTMVWVIEPCNLTIDTADKKHFTFKTQPGSVLVQKHGILVEIDAPVSERGKLSEKVSQIEQMLLSWKIAPSRRMRAELNGWKTPSRAVPPVLRPASQPSTRSALTQASSNEADLSNQKIENPKTKMPPLADLPVMMRTGIELDQTTGISFRVQGSHISGWSLTVEIQTAASELNRLDRNAGLPRK